MKKIILYIATSLDGFIARPDGKLDWLFALPNPDEIDHGYNEVLNQVDTILMGNNTYKDLLGFGIPWPYPDKLTYVLTRKKDQKDKEKIKFIFTDIIAFTKALKESPGKDIWLAGGGQVLQPLLNAGLIDALIICIIPTVIGKGIPLFLPGTFEKTFILKNSITYETGVVQLSYSLLK